MMSYQTVGIPELRENLTDYVRRVRAREVFKVTESNEPVAILAPVPGHTTVLDRLAGEGRVIPPQLDLVSLGPPPAVPGETSMSETLEEQRRERLR